MRMDKHYAKLINQLDELMIALTKQKHLGLDPEVINALKNLTRARNAFKREYIQTLISKKKGALDIAGLQ
jgi:hypothetical protein